MSLTTGGCTGERGIIMRYFIHYVWSIRVDGEVYESSNEISESTANIIMHEEDIMLTDEEKDELAEKGDVHVLVKKTGKTSVWMHIYND